MELAENRRAARATNRAVTMQLLNRARTAKSESETSLPGLTRTQAERSAARGALDSLTYAILRFESAVR